MLMAAELPVPKGIWSHGWVNFSGRRFSKTAGVRVELNEAIERYGPDPFRYFLLREVPWDGSGDFSWERFDARYEADLANGYGNLASRVVAMTVRYCAATVPDRSEPTPLDNFAQEVVENYRRAMDQHLLHQGAQEVWRLVDRANAFVEETAPWNLAKSGNTEELQRALAALARALARITLMASPFMPNKTQEAWRALGLAGDPQTATWEMILQPPVGGKTVSKGAPLFPKVSREQVTA
jgi:methionyl-tRNA synthetase